MSTTANKVLGQLIQKQRKSKNYTIPEIAEKLGVSVGFISNLENGKNDVFKLDLLSKITRELDLSLTEIAPELSIQIDQIDMNTSKDKIEIQLTNQGIKNIELINQQVTAIVDTYLKAISEFEYHPEAIKAISNHLINELEYSNKIKNLL